MLVLFSGCTQLVAQYDPLTIDHLIEIKAETQRYFTFYAQTDVTAAKGLEPLKEVIRKVDDAVVYEQGKDQNEDTVAQLKEFQATLRSLIKRLESSGKISAYYAWEKSRQLAAVVDLIMETEREKLR